MPKVETTPEAILEAVKRIDIVSELLDDKNKNNLKMIVEGKVSGGKQIGPYARLLGWNSDCRVAWDAGEYGTLAEARAGRTSRFSSECH